MSRCHITGKLWTLYWIWSLMMSWRTTRVIWWNKQLKCCMGWSMLVTSLPTEDWLKWLEFVWFDCRCGLIFVSARLTSISKVTSDIVLGSFVKISQSCLLVSDHTTCAIICCQFIDILCRFIWCSWGIYGQVVLSKVLWCVHSKVIKTPPYWWGVLWHWFSTHAFHGAPWTSTSQAN